MSDIRLYVDEDAEQRAFVAGLRDRDIDVVTAAGADMLGSTDREQLNYAIGYERAVYSLKLKGSGTFFDDNVQHKTRKFPPKNEPDPGP